MMPRARTDRLVIQALPDETLVYDLRTHAAHCLNRSATLVRRHCDGRTPPGVLAQLAAADLLVPPDEAAAPASQTPRRALLHAGAIVAGLLLPVACSIVAPTAAATLLANSCKSGKGNNCQRSGGQPCTGGGYCSFMLGQGCGCR
jgi:hypothetical protein